MDSKERVMRSLDFLPVDRIPRFDGFWPEFEDIIKKRDGIGQDTELTDYFDIDIIIAVADETPYPGMWDIVSENDREIIIRSRYGALVRSRKEGYFEENLDFTIKTYEDLDKFPFESAKLDSRYTDFLKLVKREKEKGKCVFGKVGGPFIRSTFIRGKENFLMDIAGDEEFAKAMVEKLADFLLEVALEELKRADLYDTGIWIYDDMGYNNGPLFSPKAFEKIFLPSYRKMVGELKKAGAKKVCLHSDGDIRLLLDMLIDAGIEAINPVEPRAGMNIGKLKQKYGRKLAYIGGMCNSDVLKNGPDDRITSQAGEIIELAKDGGVIIGSHSIGIDIPVENYLLYYDYVNKNGKF